MEQDRSPSGKLLFDLYRDHLWVGMSEGTTPQEAREKVRRVWTDQEDLEITMVPYYGRGTSDSTYTALTGHAVAGSNGVHIPKGQFVYGGTVSGRITHSSSQQHPNFEEVPHRRAKED